jgi:hypothetical protein
VSPEYTEGPNSEGHLSGIQSQILTCSLPDHLLTMDGQCRSRGWRRLATLLLLVLLIGTIVLAEEEGQPGEEEEEEEEEDNDYLYANDDAVPIIEYIPDIPEDGQEAELPYFLLGPESGPRVVEFYAPWCPHVSMKTCYLCAL